MQTFLVDKSFRYCAAFLDSKRLGKQRVECMQIYNALQKRKVGNKGGWVNHPAVLMWEGFEEHLKCYQYCMIDEWVRRGYKNNMTLIAPEIKLEKCSITCATNDKVIDVDWYCKVKPLPWLTDELIESHQSNLVRKDPEYYKKLFNVPDDIEYIWPVRV